MYKFAIYSRYDVMINSEAYNQLLKEKEELEKQLSQMKEDNDSLAAQIKGVQSQIKDITRANNIARIQEYIADNEVVKEENLSDMIYKLYNSDEDNGLVTMIDNEYIESLITRAHNSKSSPLGKGGFAPRDVQENDEDYKKLKNKTNFFKDQFIKTFGYILSDSQNKLLEDELYNHMDKLWFNEIYEPDRKFIMNLVKKIAIEGRV